MKDILITWPKTRPLESYLDECAKAVEQGLSINFRVPYPPAGRTMADVGKVRVYVVHDGAVRGWQAYEGAIFRAEGEVHGVAGEPDWPEGWYIVRSPLWHPCTEWPMRGFQGWRYFTWPEGAQPPARQ